MNNDKLFAEIDHLGSLDEYLAFMEEHFGLEPSEISLELEEKLEKIEPVTWEEVLAQNGMGGIWDEELAKKRRPQDYPKGTFHLDTHFRGASAHRDLRIKVNDHLRGWTITDQVEGAIKERVDTLTKARQYKWNDPKIFKFQPNMGDKNVKTVTIPKSDQPLVWLNVRNVVFPAGSVGATRFEKGVFLSVDEGMAYQGVQKPYFKEWFLKGKHFKGRFVVRLIPVRPEWVKKPKARLQWQCVTPSTLIIANYATKEAEDIKIGDRVLTHTGKFQKVTKIFKRNYSGQIFRLKIHGIRLPLEITSEHPILTIFAESNLQKEQPTWKKIKDLTIGNMVMTPKIREKTSKDFVIHASGNNRWKKFEIRPCAELLRLIGYYLGDGTIWETNGRGAASRGLRFSLNPKKDSIIQDDLIQISNKLFSKPPYIKIENSGKGKKNLLTMIILSTPLADDFKKYFGQHSTGKRIHPKIFELDQELQQELLKAYRRADGCILHHSSPTEVITTISPVLRDQLLLLCNTAGLRGHWIESIYKGRISYKICYPAVITERTQKLQSDSFVFRRIDKIERIPYSGSLFNFHVEADKSYCANFVTVHNCWMAESTPKGQLPYLLSPRGRSRKDVAPPSGESWLPPEWEAKIKQEFRWWPDSKSKQAKIKLIDEAYNDLIERGEIKARRLKLSQDLQTDTAVIIMKYGELKKKGFSDEKIIEETAQGLLPIGFDLEYWKKKVKKVLHDHGLLSTSIRKRGFEDFEYLLHHIHIGDDGEEEIHHCLLCDHIANLFEQAHLAVKKGVPYLEGKKIQDGIFHVIKGLESTQEAIWSGDEAEKNKIKPKAMKKGMTLKEKSKEW